MATDNNIKSFTASDIEKYHKGLLSAREMHTLEKAALDDPFLADALEGYLNPGVDLRTDLEDLKKRLAEKTENAKVVAMASRGNRRFPWLRIAVILVLIAGAGWMSYTFVFKSKPNDVAQLAPEESKKQVEGRIKDSVVSSLSPQTTWTKDSADRNRNRSAVNTAQGSVKEDNVKNKAASEEITLRSTPAAVSKEGSGPLEHLSSGTTVTVKKPEEYYKSGLSDNKSLATNAPVIKPNSNAVIKNNADSSVLVIGYGTRKQFLANPGGEPLSPLKEKSNPADDNTKSFGYTDNDLTAQKNEIYQNPNFFRGRVTDAHNNALPFANIISTRDNVGTYSDAKGNFALISTDSVMNVQVKVVGFESKKLNLQNNVASNQVVMQEDRSVAAKVLDTVKRNYARRSADAGMTLEEPEPADGWPYYDSYLANNLNIPETFDTRKREGADAVEVSFEVNKNGEPVNLRIEKSLCDKCDKEAIRLIKEGPKWKRKAKKGRRTTVTIPFNKID